MFGNMLDGDEDRLFGTEVIQSSVIAQGTALVGDVNQATVWDRERARATFTETGNFGGAGDLYATNRLVFPG